MRKRSKAREYALQILYQLDIRRSALDELLQDFWREHAPSAEIRDFANLLAHGVADTRPELDAVITKHTDNWDLKRMAVIDRNILRLGAFELLHLSDVPSSVSINEAIELAKRFGDAESTKFINGVLDAISKSNPKSAPPSAAPTAADAPSESAAD